MHSDLGAHSRPPPSPRGVHAPLVWACRATLDVPQAAGPHGRPGGATGPSHTGSHQLWWLLPPPQGSFHCYKYSCVFHPSVQVTGNYLIQLMLPFLFHGISWGKHPRDGLGRTGWLRSHFCLNRHFFLGHSTRVGCTSTPTLKGVIKMQQDWKNFTSQWNVTSFVSRCWRRWG